MAPASEKVCCEALKPAKSIVGSVPGMKMTPVESIRSPTPATPSFEIACVANVTRDPVMEETASTAIKCTGSGTVRRRDVDWR